MTENRRTLYPIITYADADAAIDFLLRAFGFEEHAIHRDEDGRLVHAELRFDTGILMPGQAAAGVTPVPTAIYVAVDDTDAHHARAVAEGARVVRELNDTPYGSRDYAAEDPEGNTWYFGTYRP